MSGEPTIRARIKTVMDTVSGVGLVYTRERWASDWAAYLSAFKATVSGADYIRGWTIACEAAIRGEGDFGDTNVERTYRFRIRGYYGLDDAAASENAAFALTEAVMDALDADATLHSYYSAPLCSCPVFELRMYGDVLCHYMEIEQEVTVIV